MGLDQVPDTMLACQVLEYNKPYVIHEIPTPKNLEPYDMLVKVAVASLCHTDFLVQEGVFNTKLPCTGSHEGAGTVVAVGSAVKDFKEGDRVMNGLGFHRCGECEDCTGPENYVQYCPKNKGSVGVRMDGNFADYVVVDARNTALLPKEVSFEIAAPLACAGCTVFRALLQTELKEGQVVGIVGSGGGLGHLCIQFAKSMGLKIVAIDARDEGLELSKEHKPDLLLDARKGDAYLVEEVQKFTGKGGVDASINLADAPQAAGTACAITKTHGLLVQISQPEPIVIPFKELIFRDIRIKGSRHCAPVEAKRMLQVAAKNGVTVKTNLFHGLKEIPKMVELSLSGKMAGKGVVIVDPSQM
ncbi:alcohol dehydrogenase [Rhizodiscina lignyota]|uniref:Alcohol dehydrogenase n=1 Tax=Rhizodiscina lignyota TaxID=1504668 RepID=A0A9P4M9B7_9PEZI|nr:alcohol dehydrogenase [Rhizodiscina lignyota]